MSTTTYTETVTASTSDEPRWLDAEQQSVWRAFLEMQNRLGARLNRQLLDRSGVSGADFAVLVQLSEHAGGCMRVLELARGLRWEKSRLSHQLSRMQQRGLIERLECPEDRRGAFVQLTADGRSTVESAAPQHVDSVRRYFFDDLDAEQLAAFAQVCRSVLTRLDGETCPAADAAPCPTADAAFCPETESQGGALADRARVEGPARSPR